MRVADARMCHRKLRIEKHRALEKLNGLARPQLVRTLDAEGVEAIGLGIRGQARSD